MGVRGLAGSVEAAAMCAGTIIKLINHKQNKIQPTEWDKIFSNEATDKGLIFRTYKHVGKYP